MHVQDKGVQPKRRLTASGAALNGVYLLCSCAGSFPDTFLHGASSQDASQEDMTDRCP